MTLNRKILTLLGVFFLFFVGGQVFSAEVPYSINPIYPDNQINKNWSYYDLTMTPGATQTIEIEVINTSNAEIDIEANAFSGMTNRNGFVDYLPESEAFKYDKTLKYSFSDIAKVEEVIKVPPKETRMVPVTITMPSEAYDGTILGGIEFVQKDEEISDNSSGGMAINNKFRYLMPVKLSVSDAVVKPELVLNDVKASQVSFRNVISANLQNTEMTIINDVAVEAKVTKKGSNDVLYTSNAKGMQVAPNSNFDLPISLGSQPFKAGKYMLYLVVTAQDNQKWEFKKEFDITSEEASKFNGDSAIELDQETPWVLYISLVVGSVLLIGLLIYFVLRHRKKVAEQQQVKEQTARKKRRKRRD